MMPDCSPLTTSSVVDHVAGLAVIDLGLAVGRGGGDVAVLKIGHHHFGVVEVHGGGLAGHPSIVPHPHLVVLEHFFGARSRESRRQGGAVGHSVGGRVLDLDDDLMRRRAYRRVAGPAAMAPYRAAIGMEGGFAVGAADAAAVAVEDDVIAGMFDHRRGLAQLQRHVAHRDPRIIDHRGRCLSQGRQGKCRQQRGAQQGLGHGAVPWFFCRNSSRTGRLGQFSGLLVWGGCAL